MENITNPTAQRLLRSFMQFNKVIWHQWHQHSITGCKPSEIRVLFCIRKQANPDTPEIRALELSKQLHAGKLPSDLVLVREIKVSEISKQLQVTSPTITQLLNGLEENGLVERRTDPTDRRAVGVVLTEKGEMVTRQAADALSASMNGLIEYLGEEESEQLTELLSKVFHYYNEKATMMDQFQWNGNEEI